jgi:hypothetical protein
MKGHFELTKIWPEIWKPISDEKAREIVNNTMIVFAERWKRGTSVDDILKDIVAGKAFRTEYGHLRYVKES